MIGDALLCRVGSASPDGGCHPATASQWPLEGYLGAIGTPEE